MSRLISKQEWGLVLDAIDGHASDERDTQQRLFRLAQALIRHDHELALRFVQDGAPVDLPLLFDEKNGGVPSALSVLPTVLAPELKPDGSLSFIPPPMTLMAMAAVKNDMGTIQWLLENNASPEMVMNKGRDAAWFALEAGSMEAYEFLMSKGISPHLRLMDGSNRTRLMASVLMRSEDSVRDLIRRKVNLNAYDRAGRTALHHNFAQDPYTDEDVTIAQILLAQGSNPNIEDNDGIPAHALAKNEVQQALMTGFHLAKVTDEARRKIDAPVENLDLPDPSTDPGLPQVKRPRPIRPRL